MIPAEVHRADLLLAVLGRARELGFLGPQEIDLQVLHALGYAGAILDRALPPAARLVDLGSGGGIPGLVLASHEGLRGRLSQVALLEGSSKRAEWLRHATAQLGLTDFVSVVDGRAEDVGHQVPYRSQFDVATARSFGRPAVVAECAAPLLRTGGILLVSEPPDSSDTSAPSPGQPPVRWDAAGLAELGLEFTDVHRSAGYGYAVLQQVTVCSARYPRRVGVPEKRPLF
jgi:16S rRNA (guanine527-N7)-methyltransferase